MVAICTHDRIERPDASAVGKFGRLVTLEALGISGLVPVPRSLIKDFPGVVRVRHQPYATSQLLKTEYF